MMSEREINTANRLAAAKQNLLATVNYGVTSIIDAKSGSYYAGVTIELAQEAVHRLRDDGLVELDNRYQLSITEAGKAALADLVEPGSAMDQMAQLTAEYTQKMRILGAQVTRSAQHANA